MSDKKGIMFYCRCNGIGKIFSKFTEMPIFNIVIPENIPEIAPNDSLTHEEKMNRPGPTFTTYYVINDEKIFIGVFSYVPLIRELMSDKNMQEEYKIGIDLCRVLSSNCKVSLSFEYRDYFTNELVYSNFIDKRKLNFSKQFNQIVKQEK